MQIFKDKRSLLPVAIIAAGIALMLLLISTNPTPEIVPPKERVWAVSAVRAKLATNTPNLQLYGSVESPRNTTLRSALAADILKELVDEGDRVTKGQLLVVLDNRDAKLILNQRQAEVKSLKSQIGAEQTRYESDQKAFVHEKELVALAEKQVRRRQRLLKSKTGSALELDTAKQAVAQQRLLLTARERAINDHTNRLANLEAQLARSQAMADQSALDVERSQVRAPFDGKIAKILVSVGNRVRPGDRLVEIFDNSTIEVRAQVPQRYTKGARDAVNSDQSITAKAFVQGQEVSLVLDRLATKVEVGRSGVDALFSVTQNADLLELGKTINIFVDLQPMADTIDVPIQSLYGMDRVYKIADSRLKGIDIKQVGNIINEDGSQSVLITGENLQDGDLILATHIPVAIDGLKVTIKNKVKTE